ncbi:Lrp/AsnC family transcriptional regulator [Micrococcales bacterium 31B]|nr:Lrp/AsnC family transcriptional regulator [Micrococcales bacterium 31B]
MTFDERLVRALQADGRATFSDLARDLGASRASVGARVADLLETQAIKIVAAIDPRVLGLHAIAHLAFRVQGAARRVAEQVQAADGCVFASLTTGAHALVAEFRVPSISDLYATVEHMRGIPGVVGVEMLHYRSVIRSVFHSDEVSAPQVTLDAMDFRIIEVLQRDGRIAYEALGHEVGLSTSAARSRLLRLVSEGVVHIGAVRMGHTGGITLGVGVQTAGFSDAAVAYFSALPGTEFIATCLGRFTMLVMVNVSDPAAAAAVLDGARAVEGVMHLENWLHLHVVRERYERPVPLAPQAE